MKIFVTGASGFIGKPLLRRLLAEGHDVHALSRQTRFLEFPGVHAHLGDAADPATWTQAAARAPRIDMVIHLAAAVTYYGPWDTFRKMNVEATQHALAFATHVGARRFVYGSSIEAVGPVKHRDVPATSRSRCRPISPYGRSKVLAETAVREWSQGHQRSVLLRIGNVYGPVQHNMVVEFAESLKQHGRIAEFWPVYGRRLIQPAYIDDVVEGIVASLRADVPASVTVTLAGPWVTVEELLRLCARASGVVLPERQWRWHDAFFLKARARYHRWKGAVDTLTYLMAPPAHRPHRASDLSEAKTVLNWTPTTSLEEGVRRTLAWAEPAQRQKAA